MRTDLNELQSFFNGRVQVVSSIDPDKALPLLGMDPIGLRTLNFNYTLLNKWAIDQGLLQKDLKSNQIILIERSNPDQYYLNDAVKKGAGKTRRSIKNHKNLVDTIKPYIKSEFQFKSIALENLNLKQQINLFSSAALVIGQHGAGLSNIIWMNKKTSVVEFGFKNKAHFKKVALALDLNYLKYQDFKDPHISINPSALINWLKSQKQLIPFFK
ncbi:MAG: glycosyltransferase 61 family protein [Bacteroidia bacterium]